MPKKKADEEVLPVEEKIVLEEASVAPEAASEAVQDPIPSVEGSQEEETLEVDVHFTDEHIARISEAGFEPASVRNEFGLAKMNGEPKITLSEAIARAKVRYGKV